MKNPSKLAAEFLAKGKSRTCPIYDMHCHFGDYKAIYFPNRTPEAMVATMDRRDIRGSTLEGVLPKRLFQLRVGEVRRKDRRKRR